MRNAACHFQAALFLLTVGVFNAVCSSRYGLTPCQNAHDHIAQGVNQNVVAIHMHPALVFAWGFQAWVLAVIRYFVAIAAVRAV